MQQLLQMQQMQQLQGLGGGGLPVNSWGGIAPPARRNPVGGGAARLQVAQMRNAQLRNNRQLAALGLDPTGLKKAKKDKKGKKKRASKLEFKRVDQLWDSTIHNYKLTDTAEDEESSEYDQYLFNVRRTFDWEGKYKVCLGFIWSYVVADNFRRLSSTSRASSLRRLSMKSWMVSKVSA